MSSGRNIICKRTLASRLADKLYCAADNNMCEVIEEEMTKSLLLLPPPPADLELLNPFTKCALSHQHIVLHLLRMNVNGVLIRKQFPFFQSEKSPVSGEQQNLYENVSSGCLYVPSSDSNQVILLMSVDKNFLHENAISRVKASAEYHLKCIGDIGEAATSASKSTRNEHNVQILICLPWKNPKSQQFQLLKLSLDNFLKENFCSFSFVVQASFTDEKSFVKDLNDILNSSKTSSSNFARALISHYSCTSSQSEEYAINTAKLNALTFQHNIFDEPDKLIDLFNFYFSLRETKIVMIPDFEENFLCCFDSELFSSESIFFYENVVKPLEQSSGILINRFTNKHLETIVSNEKLKPQPFEIDWIYLGNEKIVIFDVRAHPTQTHPVANKIGQCVENILPQMQLILHSFLSEFQRPQLKYSNLIESLFKVVVYLPGVTYDAFVQEIDLLQKLNAEKREQESHFPEALFKTLEQNWLQIAKFLVFVVSIDDYKTTKVVRITGELEVVDTFYSIGELFRSEPGKSSSVKRLQYNDDRKQSTMKRSLSRESLKTHFFEYSSALFTSSRMNLHSKLSNSVRTTFHAETHFPHSFRESGRSAPDYNFVLSPDQHRILTESSKTHVIVTGQPGTGKTTLLLAKCEQMAQLDEIDSIFFCCYHNRNLFYKNFLTTIEKNGSQRLKHKIAVQAIDPTVTISFANVSFQ